MKLETELLEIIPLNLKQFELWLNNINELEKELNCTYKATKLEGFFLDILKSQLEITKKDPLKFQWHSFWMLIRREDRVVVGLADFKDVPNENGEVEIGYGLGKEFEHNGYMREAVNEMCNWAFKQEGVKSVIAETELNGTASQNILKSCGFKEYKRKDTVWWKLG